MGKSGLLYCLLGCLMPCIPTIQARERYNIEGDTAGDVGTAVCCTACVMCQTAVEIKEIGVSS
jgi:Cys-rich protein (TIGR01571 family)